ncbi:glycosyltransferase [Polymorphobacter sp.]|uniref:glycosyltransferase n=1 Tax=Polymorphobacter sp. TaxID=1909290 RepID=UPI003F6F4615
MTGQAGAALRISVVTLSFNQAPFLEAALASLHDQHYPGLEHIVVDPGSTDGSREILECWRPRLSALLLDPDKGPADGLNKGFAAATGDILGYINADDLALPGSLAAVAGHFAAHPGLGQLLGRGWIIDRAGERVRETGSSQMSLADFGHGAMTYLQQAHYFSRAAFMAGGGFNPDNRTSWDAELLVDMALGGATALNVPDRLGAFRLYGDTITGSGRLAQRMAEDLARIRCKALGRRPRGLDRIEAPARLLARRLRDPVATLGGIAARLRPDPAAG